MDYRRTTVTAAMLFAAIFTLCAVSSANATDVVWKKADGGSILDGGRTVVADKAGSHADFETGPLPLDKADTPIDESVVKISFEFETLKFPAKVGIKSGYKTYLFDLDGCKSGRSRLPPEDCKVHGKIRFTFNSTSKEFRILKSDTNSYHLHTLLDTSDPYVFVADLGRGTKLKNFVVQTSEEVFIARHLANGATQAFDNDGDDLFCREGYANCAGTCFGVNKIGRYCMCYPRGYVDVHDHFQIGPKCLKYGGDGITVPSPKDNQGGFKVYEDGHRSRHPSEL